MCDVPGTEYSRNMAKLAKTLQQTISEDVRIVYFLCALLLTVNNNNDNNSKTIYMAQ